MCLYLSFPPLSVDLCVSVCVCNCRDKSRNNAAWQSTAQRHFIPHHMFRSGSLNCSSLLLCRQHAQIYIPAYKHIHGRATFLPSPLHSTTLHITPHHQPYEDHDHDNLLGNCEHHNHVEPKNTVFYAMRNSASLDLLKPFRSLLHSLPPGGRKAKAVTTFTDVDFLAHMRKCLSQVFPLPPSPVRSGTVSLSLRIKISSAFYVSSFCSDFHVPAARVVEMHMAIILTDLVKI